MKYTKICFQSNTPYGLSFIDNKGNLQKPNISNGVVLNAGEKYAFYTLYNNEHPKYITNLELTAPEREVDKLEESVEDKIKTIINLEKQLSNERLINSTLQQKLSNLTLHSKFEKGDEVAFDDIKGIIISTQAIVIKAENGDVITKLENEFDALIKIQSAQQIIETVERIEETENKKKAGRPPKNQ